MNNTIEIWKDVPEYEGYYQVSNMGEVRSLDRTGVDKIGRKTTHRGRVLTPMVNRGGYEDIGLSKNSKSKHVLVHQLVMMAFSGHKPNGHTLVVDHINGVRADNRLSNLQIVTQRENQSTCYRRKEEEYSSRHVGVSWCRNVGKWRTQIVFEGVVLSLGYFESEDSASSIYQEVLSKINREEFNPSDYKPVHSSRYKGVSYRARLNRWRVGIFFQGKQYELPTQPTEELAYQALLIAEQEVKDGVFLANRMAKKNKVTPMP